MSFVQNFPLFIIIASLFSGALCLLLSRKASYVLSLTLLSVCLVLDGVLLSFTIKHGAFAYSMGEFPAPWGNEIRAGVLEALVLLVFLLVLLCSLIAGRHYLLLHIDETKANLYAALVHLSTAAIAALVFTNDLFTGYVFLEVLTLASCGLMVIRETGRNTLAAVRYMIMNLFGSGLFLMGVVLLYGMTGHLLMVPLHESIIELAADPAMTLPLTFAIGILTIGLAIKSGMFPFYFWMPDTYGWATPTTASIMSAVVSKAYLFLLIKVYFRVVGLELLETLPIRPLLLLFGIAGVILGSVSAVRADTINRMVAFSSAAQIGYIFMCIGIGGDAGYLAAIFHMLGHAVTKSLLFLTTPRLVDVSGRSMRFHDLQGSGLRDRTAGFFFLTGALSMVGVPVFAGFSSKFLITEAIAGDISPVVFTLVVIALVISTILNALYFLRTVIRIYSHPEGASDEYIIPHTNAVAGPLPAYLLPSLALLAVNVFFGLFPMLTAQLIAQGLTMLM